MSAYAILFSDNSGGAETYRHKRERDDHEFVRKHAAERVLLRFLSDRAEAVADEGDDHKHEPFTVRRTSAVFFVRFR